MYGKSHPARHPNQPDTGSDFSLFRHIGVLIGKNRVLSFAKPSVRSRFNGLEGISLLEKSSFMLYWTGDHRHDRPTVPVTMERGILGSRYSGHNNARHPCPPGPGACGSSVGYSYIFCFVAVFGKIPPAPKQPRDFNIFSGCHKKIPLSRFRNFADIIILNLRESSRWLWAKLRSSVVSQNSGEKKTNAGYIPFCQNPRRHHCALFVNQLIIQTSFYGSRIYSFRLIPGARL